MLAALFPVLALVCVFLFQCEGQTFGSINLNHGGGFDVQGSCQMNSRYLVGYRVDAMAGGQLKFSVVDTYTRQSLDQTLNVPVTYVSCAENSNKVVAAGTNGNIYVANWDSTNPRNLTFQTITTNPNYNIRQAVYYFVNGRDWIIASYMDNSNANKWRYVMRVDYTNTPVARIDYYISVNINSFLFRLNAAYPDRLLYVDGGSLRQINLVNNATFQYSNTLTCSDSTDKQYAIDVSSFRFMAPCSNTPLYNYNTNSATGSNFAFTSPVRQVHISGNFVYATYMQGIQPEIRMYRAIDASYLARYMLPPNVNVTATFNVMNQKLYMQDSFMTTVFDLNHVVIDSASLTNAANREMIINVRSVTSSITLTSNQLPSISVGGRAATSISWQINGTQIKATAPFGVGRNQIVTLTWPNSAWISSISSDFSYNPPTIVNVTGSPGPTAGGTIVRLTCTNLGQPGTDAVTVFFGGSQVTSFFNVTDTVFFITPSSTVPGPASIRIQTGSQDSSEPFFVMYSAPIISSTSPSGNFNLNGNENISIYGSNFGVCAAGVNCAPIYVTIGGKNATNVIYVSNGEIRCTTPAGGGKNLAIIVNVNGYSSVRSNHLDIFLNHLAAQ